MSRKPNQCYHCGIPTPKKYCAPCAAKFPEDAAEWEEKQKTRIKGDGMADYRIGRTMKRVFSILNQAPGKRFSSIDIRELTGLRIDQCARTLQKLEAREKIQSEYNDMRKVYWIDDQR